ncbi:hypothetical protein DW204_09890 [Phocaeicola plebeius]|uniref:Uncharacterized protein n=1 Tax=Phocaeicola plebeius TaxID=310297 RepID=A0A414WX92_9BACT|nr:hypothetical protein DW204_09890 [Phocaeicola plebeius]
MKYKKVVRLYSNSRVSKYYKATNRNRILLPFAITCNICIALHSQIGKIYVAAHIRTLTDSLL